MTSEELRIWVPVAQTIATTFLVSGVFYFIQRYFKRKDDKSNERNKSIVAKTIEAEIEIFEIFKKVYIQYDISSSELVNFATNIKQLRINNLLFIGEDLIRIISEFEDYLLLVSEDQSNRTSYTEEKLINKFKTKFRR